MVTEMLYKARSKLLDLEKVSSSILFGKVAKYSLSVSFLTLFGRWIHAGSGNGETDPTESRIHTGWGIPEVSELKKHLAREGPWSQQPPSMRITNKASARGMTKATTPTPQC